MNDAAQDNNRQEPDAPKDAGLPARAEPKAVAREEQIDWKLLPFEPKLGDEPRFSSAHPAKEPTAQSRWLDGKMGRIAAAASLATVVVIGGAAAAAHVHSLRVAHAEEAQARSLARRLDQVTTRLESLEANRSRDDLANMRKVLAEIKSSAASTRDVGGAVTQLAARVDRLEKEQTARLDKLGDRLDKDSAARLGDMSARLEKIETKVTAPAPVVAAVAPKPAPTPTPPTKTEVAKTQPNVSYETTASIDKPRQHLRNFYLSDIHNGYAMIDSPAGEFAVGPGDMVPGGGRVLRIERHGRDWVVVTTIGQIDASAN